jgi:hypothetical protein
MAWGDDMGMYPRIQPAGTMAMAVVSPSLAVVAKLCWVTLMQTSSAFVSAPQILNKGVPLFEAWSTSGQS